MTQRSLSRVGNYTAWLKKRHYTLYHNWQILTNFLSFFSLPHSATSANFTGWNFFSWGRNIWDT